MYTKKLLLINVLICGEFTNFIALLILTEAHKWRVTLDVWHAGPQVFIAILIIIIDTYYILFNGGLSVTCINNFGCLQIWLMFGN